MNAAPVLPSKHLLSLDADCLGEILSWLKLDELLAVSRTCKRLNRIAGDVFQTNYSGLVIQAYRNEIYPRNCRSPGLTYSSFSKRKLQMAGLENFIENILFHFSAYDRGGLDLETAQYIAPNCNKLLKQMKFASCYLNQPLIQCIEEMLKNVETLIIHCGAVDQDVYETIPLLCVNLKRLCVSKVDFQNVNIGENPWLLRHYPRLEHLEWIPHNSKKGHPLIPELSTFFELNRSVQSFSTNFGSLLPNGQLLLQSNIELDDLIISSDFNEYTNWKQHCELLNTLYERGKFKRLHIGTSKLEQAVVSEFSGLKSLESLHLVSAMGVNLSQLTNLKDLSLGFIKNLNDARLHADTLMNLQRLQVREASINDVKPLIYHSKMLTILTIGRFSPYGKQFLDLKAMNRMRKQLNGARKLTIYVPDRVFVATRYAMNETDLDSIEMRRTESVQWDNYLPQGIKIDWF